MGKLADQKLETLGGQRVHTLGLGDDDANLEAGLRIRIHFIRIRIQPFRLNSNTDPGL